MTNLDTKLRELYDGHPDHMDEWVAQIKACFEEAGYYKPTYEQKGKTVKLKFSSPLSMTGKEWLTRFEQALSRYAVHPDPNPLELVKIESVEWAARKASGLDKEEQL